MLYAITDRRLYAENPSQALERLVALSGIWAANGVAFVQIRENDLSGRDQVELARVVVAGSFLARGQQSRELVAVGRASFAHRFIDVAFDGSNRQRQPCRDMPVG